MMERPTLKELCATKIEMADPHRHPEKLFRYIDISAVDNVEKRIGTPSVVAGKTASVRARQIVRTGDVIVATTRPNLNAVAKIEEAHDGDVCSTGFCVLRAGDRLDPDYLFAFVQSWDFIQSLVSLTQGALYPAVTNRQVLDQRIPLRPINQQRRIAAQLKAQTRNVESARIAANTQLHEASELSDAIFREAFHLINPIAVPPVTLEPPLGWRWQKLTDVARLESGHTPSRLQPDWWGGDISWLSLTEIRALDGCWVDQTQLRTNHEGIANSAARLLPRGTVCLSRTASVGFVAIMGTPMATSQDFANWVCGDELDPEFLMYALIRSRASLRDMATGATHKTIYMPALASFYVCAPEIEEQRRIAKRLKTQRLELGALHTALRRQAMDISALPQRILSASFEI